MPPPLPPPRFVGLLIRAPVEQVAGLTGATRRLSVAGTTFDVEPLLPASVATALGVAGSPNAWHVATPVQTVPHANPWDTARAAVALMGPGALVEPDLEQQWPFEHPALTESRLAAGEICVFNDQESDLPKVDRTFAWHLKPQFTQLEDARRLAAGSSVRIAHLDTGYDPAHTVVPAHVRTDLARNFLDDQPPDDLRDPGVGGILRNPGHGTGTLSLLAGGRFALDAHGYAFDAPVGGAPDAQIVPMRVGNSVVQIRTSAVAKAIAYAASLAGRADARVDVLSMSMGGVASAAWADAVNLAYQAGIVLVCAAGNNFSAGIFGLPARSIVYPARFRRVIAACGVMADRRPYYGLRVGKMQGNWGPRSKMATAMSAFTPNVTWAELGCAGIVDMDGAGTSSATPQIAAAAALYIQKHHAALFDRTRYPESWMRVEAVRAALFGRADKSADSGSSEKLGNGILRAVDALALEPVAASMLTETPKDKAALPFLHVLTGLGAAPPSEQAALTLEATQLIHQWSSAEGPNPLEDATPDPDLPAEDIPADDVRRFLEGILEHPRASKALKTRAGEVRQSMFGRMPAPGPEPGRRRRRREPRPIELVPTPRPPTASAAPIGAPNPPSRRLRVFAVDPSLSLALETAPVSEVTIEIPWETVAPGPSGEYVEVIDYDPASNCYYAPVNLDDPAALAQDGLPPSEGTPQFHQQMAYATASLTIRNFERSLGRRVLWRPGPGAHEHDDSVFVRQLRVYPHALREANAYYSPAKVALLFGYFAADQTPADTHLPGGMIFTCLSHDIIAHETTHAILDGMHRRFLLATNPDVRAFHEAFADIVALFQHFTFRDVVRHQIATTRGSLRSHENLLGGLAGQFGRATGRRGKLRDFIGRVDENGQWTPHVPSPLDYERARESHERGAVLVGAVFDAFLKIFENRTTDLLRLASGGTGVLSPGAIHQDLVGRLASEASKAAQHVLTMCIRALDYCPPVDITFGEYLRALITADRDIVADDDLHYRTAFVDAFRQRGIYPRDVRTLSQESLFWRTPTTDDRVPSVALEEGLSAQSAFAQEILMAQLDGRSDRERVFHAERRMRLSLHRWLREHLQRADVGATDAEYLGLNREGRFEVHTARFATRIGPDGQILPQLIVGLLQRRKVPVDPGHANGPRMPFEGGCSIITDLRRRSIGFCVRKSLGSPTRLTRQQAFLAESLESPRATYFDQNLLNDELEPFAMIHRGV